MARNMPKGVEVAGLAPRLVGWLIDVSVPAALAVLVWFLQGRIDNSTTLLVVMMGISLLQLGWALLLWWGYGGRGAGVGFRVMGLQLVGLDDGKPIGWWRYFLRQLVWSALMMTVVGGVLLLIFLVIQERRQGWHDLAAKSVAIRAKAPQRRPATKTVTQPRKAPSTTTALPPHLVEKAFDGSSSPSFRADPAEVARQAASFGGHSSQGDGGAWRPPTAPGQGGVDQGRATGRRPAAVDGPTNEQPAFGYQAASAPSANPIPSANPASANSWRQPTAPQGQGETRVRPRRMDDSAQTEDGTHLAVRPGGPTPRRGDEGWYLVMDDGRQIDITGPVVVGRKPTQPVGAGQHAQLVPAGEGGHAVSKNHLRVGVDARGVWVSDTGSTNGTAVVNAQGDLEPCSPGAQVRLREGQVVSFGDRSMTLRRKPSL